MWGEALRTLDSAKIPVPLERGDESLNNSKVVGSHTIKAGGYGSFAQEADTGTPSATISSGVIAPRGGLNLVTVGLCP
jgi:hypothetical protein